ncbi:MAG: LptF/LptG family permease, partial [Tepidisphaeraceae bacterium]
GTWAGRPCYCPHMSRTLFFYIFKDLLRIFILTSGALAGIMSFGGLLRPLTEHGLDAGQAAKMLSYFLPAMTTYSLPIAALFATTMVYGRLSADNELTACRAAGISYRAIALPAVVLGLTVALISLLFLCFIVPNFTLKVEKVIYSNLARLIANSIERTHQIKFEGTTIFAQEASVAPDDPQRPDEQLVRLGGLMIVSYEKINAPTNSADRDAKPMEVPKEFYLAKQATVFIRRARGDEFTIEARLEEPGGAMFPRTFTGAAAVQGGIRTTQFGPIIIDSLIREETRFMDIRRLHELLLDPRKSRRVTDAVQRITRVAQENQFLATLLPPLRAPGGQVHFDAGGEQYDLVSTQGTAGFRDKRLIVAPGRLVQTRPDGRIDFTWDAAEIEFSTVPLSDGRMSVKALLHDVKVLTDEGQTARPDFSRQFVIAMPPSLRVLENRELEFYRKVENVPGETRHMLVRDLIRVSNGVLSEVHSRISFAVSCLILVVVGCCLGIMFKSGNFLTAFAISVVPALVCIALIVAGQHTCENIPWKLENFRNPLNMGLALIWSGNAAVFALAGVLGWRLSRQ